MKKTIYLVVAGMLLIVSFFLTSNFAFEFHDTYFIIGYASFLRALAILFMAIWLILFFSKRTAK